MSTTCDQVTVTENGIQINQFFVADKSVTSLVKTAADPEAILQRIISVGGQVLSHSASSLQTDSLWPAYGTCILHYWYTCVPVYLYTVKLVSFSA